MVGDGCGGDHRDGTEILLLCQFWQLEMLHSHMMESAKLQTLLSGLMKSDCTYRREEGRYIRWQRERGAGWVLEGEHSCIPELSIILFIFILYDECKVNYWGREDTGRFFLLPGQGWQKLCWKKFETLLKSYNSPCWVFANSFTHTETLTPNPLLLRIRRAHTARPLFDPKYLHLCINTF